MTALFLALIMAMGIFVLTYDRMKDFYKLTGELIRTAAASFKGTELTEKGEVWERVRIVMGISLGMGRDRAVRMFFVVSGLLCVMTIILLGGKTPLMITCTSAVTAAFLPYLLLRIRMERMRISSSREGELMLSELTDNYKIYYYNMKEAIDKTALSLIDAPGSKRILVNLSRGLDRAGSESSISRLLEEFSLSINTSWSNTLKSVMYFALVHGIRVDEALDDLVKTLKSARMIEEYSKRENNESAIMIRYMVPLIYLMTVISGVKIFGLGAGKFLHYQFGTEVGLTWMAIFAVVYIISYIVNSFLSANKLDL